MRAFAFECGRCFGRAPMLNEVAENKDPIASADPAAERIPRVRAEPLAVEPRRRSASLTAAYVVVGLPVVERGF